MKLDKFLDWEGYEAIDVYATKEKLYFLCNNHDFYLVVDLGSGERVEGIDMDNIAKVCNGSPDYAPIICSMVKDTGILLGMIKSMTVEELSRNSFGPYLLDPDYYSCTIEDFTGRPIIEVSFKNIINPVRIPVFLNRSETLDSDPLQIEALARKELADILSEAIGVLPSDPIKVFNELKKVDFDTAKMKAASQDFMDGIRKKYQNLMSGESKH
jgi:hypothetical protein